jgi:hypothetical protein
MRLRSFVAVVGVAAAAVVVPASGTASAVGTCSVVAPTKVVLDRELVRVPYRLAGDCAVAGTVYASWDVLHPADGVAGGLTFDGTATDTWDLHDWQGPARYTVRPWSALDVSAAVIPQNSATTTVKLGSRLTATVTRSADRLAFAASARTWSPTVGDWSRRPGVNVSLMHLATGSSTWSWVKAATTSGAGRVTLSVAPKAGHYRLMVKETDTVWASWSTVVRGS